MSLGTRLTERARRVRTFAARRKRLLVCLLASVLLAAALTALAFPIVAGHTAPPAHSRAAAVAAVERMRESPARRWAPEQLARTEQSLRDALTAYRLEEGRFVSLRDFRLVREHLRRVEQDAVFAISEAGRKRADLRETALSEIELATASVDSAESFADAMPLDQTTRVLLQQCRYHLDEALAHLEEDEPGTAAERAHEARGEAELVVRRASARVARYLEPERVAAWKSWINETVEQSRRERTSAIVVVKERRRLHLYKNGRQVASYRADMSANPLDRKLRSGDKATPEGRYRIVARKGLGESRYHRALLLDYPNQEDRRRLEEARRAGLVSRSAGPGGSIEIHGEGGRGADWTRGCIALANRDMDELFSKVGVGTAVTIVGADGNGGRFTDLVKAQATGDNN